MGCLQTLSGWAALKSESFSMSLDLTLSGFSNHSVHSTSGDKRKQEKSFESRAWMQQKCMKHNMISDIMHRFLHWWSDSCLFLPLCQLLLMMLWSVTSQGRAELLKATQLEYAVWALLIGMDFGSVSSLAAFSDLQVKLQPVTLCCLKHGHDDYAVKRRGCVWSLRSWEMEFHTQCSKRKKDPTYSESPGDNWGKNLCVFFTGVSSNVNSS